ncbi:MAG: hypothetical protein ACYTGL_29350 [Planctomycetota bacterium]|jgi:hypothetical protein
MSIIAFSLPPVYQFFADNLRDSLFSGFLALAGFLFSAKTFIVIHMKEKLYDSSEYKNKFEKLRRVNPALTKYGPLRRLSSFLFWSVLCSLITALLQLTVGLIEEEWAAWLCLSAAVVAILTLAASMILVSLNLRAWLAGLEQKES